MYRSATMHNVTVAVRTAVFENTYFSFFSDFKKNMTFYVFFEMTLKKRKKSVAKILSSMMLTLQKKEKKFVECL